ncbi:MAG: hypothetical protein PHE59_01065 [Patescibacteria group bacterium]|nr:hypothetical protein [Patescibacteria group bacterium]MDD5164262.1 hypothetical protein [Patescibacteria group bacterium]MDD5535058.1 hypothetical protein [Patescibacteria group bacterium]
MSKKNNIDKFVKEVGNTIKILMTRCEKAGMKKKTIQKFFAGEEVINCPHCKTMNMVESHYDKKEEWSMYKCLACKKTLLKDWKKISPIIVKKGGEK